MITEKFAQAHNRQGFFHTILHAEPIPDQNKLLRLLRVERRVGQCDPLGLPTR